MTGTKRTCTVQMKVEFRKREQRIRTYYRGQKNLQRWNEVSPHKSFKSRVFQKGTGEVDFVMEGVTGSVGWEPVRLKRKILNSGSNY